jgi:hypothetical protein
VEESLGELAEAAGVELHVRERATA